jgi:hypothetical protein
MPKPWTVFIWCVEDASEFRSYFLADLREMSRATKHMPLTYIIRYTSTADTFGCYDITVAAGRVEMDALDKPEPNTEQSFRNWLSKMREGAHFCDNSAVVFSGHSSGWDVGSHELIPYLPTWQIRRVFQQLEFQPDLVVFDGCYMSTLENAMEMEGVARYMVACETTSPNLGMTGCPAAFVTGGRPASPREAALALANLYIDRNDEAYRRERAVHGDDAQIYPSAYPTDVAVTDLSLIGVVVQQLRAALQSAEAPLNALVIPDDPAFPFYDLPQARVAILLHRFTEQKIEAADQPCRAMMTGMSWCRTPEAYTDRGVDYRNLRLAKQLATSPRGNGQSPKAVQESPPQGGDQPCS